MLKLTYQELANQLGVEKERVSSFFIRNGMKLENLKDVSDYIVLHNLKNK